jgi:hypothetical protein
VLFGVDVRVPPSYSVPKYLLRGGTIWLERRLKITTCKSPRGEKSFEGEMNIEEEFRRLEASALRWLGLDQQSQPRVHENAQMSVELRPSIYPLLKCPRLFVLFRRVLLGVGSGSGFCKKLFSTEQEVQEQHSPFAVVVGVGSAARQVCGVSRAGGED